MNAVFTDMPCAIVLVNGEGKNISVITCCCLIIAQLKIKLETIFCCKRYGFICSVADSINSGF